MDRRIVFDVRREDRPVVWQLTWLLLAVPVGAGAAVASWHLVGGHGRAGGPGGLHGGGLRPGGRLDPLGAWGSSVDASSSGRPDRPVMIPQISCYADAGCFVAEAGSQAAETLTSLPALPKPHDPAALGSVTAAEADELLAAAGELALAAGWVQRVDGYWLCPTHAGVYLDAEPRHFTVAECVHRHRLRQAGQRAPQLRIVVKRIRFGRHFLHGCLPQNFGYHQDSKNPQLASSAR